MQRKSPASDCMAWLKETYPHWKISKSPFMCASRDSVSNSSGAPSFLSIRPSDYDTEPCKYLVIEVKEATWKDTIVPWAATINKTYKQFYVQDLSDGGNHDTIRLVVAGWI